jgi:hypothetical protein
LLQPRDEARRRLLRRLNRLLELRSAVGGLSLEREQICALLLDGADAGHPQIARVAGQVQLRLRKQRRDALQFPGEPGCVGGREREGVLPHLDDRVVRRTFVRGRVALRRPDLGVERRIALPRLEDAQVEVEAVHLGAQQVIVDLLRDRPRLRLDRLQPGLISLQLRVLAGKRRRRVVRRALAQRGPLELAPLGEQRGQILIAALRGCGTCGWAAGDRSHGEDSGCETSGCGLKAHRFIIYSARTQIGGTITMDLLTLIIILALVGTGVSMALGLLAMSGGGATDRLFSTRLMWVRVGFQAFTLLLLAAAVFLR